MQRLTSKVYEVYTVAETAVKRAGNGYSGEAVERLAKFENMIEKLLKERDATAAQLERLRREGREKSVTFKQLLARKLTNSGMLTLFESHGIETE